MIHGRDRLQQALGKATLARLIQGMAARLRFGQSLGGTLTLPGVSAEERSAIDHFLGRRPSSGTPLVVRLAEMERILCESGMRSEERRVGKECRSRWPAGKSEVETSGSGEPGTRRRIKTR